MKRNRQATQSIIGLLLLALGTVLPEKAVEAVETETFASLASLESVIIFITYRNYTIHSNLGKSNKE